MMPQMSILVPEVFLTNSTPCNCICSDDKVYIQHLLLSSCKGSVNFKFGVLFAKDGQLTDDEMLSNGKCPLICADTLFCLVAVLTVQTELTC